MLRNGVAGFALVFLVLALFLELSLAFRVSLGIPFSFRALALGAGLRCLHQRADAVRLRSGLGVVVDDALLVGETISGSVSKTVSLSY